MLKPRSPIATAEADLAALEKRRAGLDARRTSAASASLTAVADRRRLWVDSDEPDAKALAAADRACRDAADSETAMVDALAEVDSRIAGVKDRLARLRAAEDRERQAAALDAVADVADAAAKRITKAAREIAAARADLAAAITPDLAGLYAPPWRESYGTPTALVTRFYGLEGRVLDTVLSPEAVAARFVGHLVAPVLPTLGIADEAEAHTFHQLRTVTHTLVAVDTAEGAIALLAGPLRARAEALRNGEVVADVAPFAAWSDGDTTMARTPDVPAGFTAEEQFSDAGNPTGVVKLRPIGGAAA